MAHYTVPALPPDANGDVRYPEEAAWPIKARCIRCGGQKTVRVVREASSCEFDRQPCPHCNGRGYYFLPLGD